MRSIEILTRFISPLSIFTLKYYCLKLLQNCKSYQLKTRFCSTFFGILRYSPHKTELDNLDPVIWAQYVAVLLFGGDFLVQQPLGQRCKKYSNIRAVNNEVVY
jgi:hypothetical protein